MKQDSNYRFTRATLVLTGLAVGLVFSAIPARADFDDDTFTQSNLVSNLAGIAQLQDTNLVNAWGMAFSTTSPFWISDNGTGFSTLYAVTNDSSGVPHVVKQGLTVTIPGDGAPTGQIVNNSGAFHNDSFIFAGWLHIRVARFPGCKRGNSGGAY